MVIYRFARPCVGHVDEMYENQKHCVSVGREASMSFLDMLRDSFNQLRAEIKHRKRFIRRFSRLSQKGYTLTTILRESIIV
jgi:hypothetical protein